MRNLAALTLAFLLVGSGCLSASGKTVDDSKSPDGTGPSTSFGSPQKTDHSTTKPKPSASPSPSSTNTTGGAGNKTVPQTAQKPWPDINTATIRPGVQTDTTTGQCTSNFIFRSPDNATLYLGLAAHCVNGLKLGDPVTIEGASKAGKLAYSSWIALKLTCAPSAAGTGCTGGQFDNDFALIVIDPADRGRVHPAVRFFGGPTTLADSASLHTGDRVLVYGHSGLWLEAENLHHHEGIVTGGQSGPQFSIQTFTPGIPGDSGSGVLTRDGRAAGVLVTLCFAPCAGQNGVAGLAGQLALAKKNGLDTQLATWRLVDDGLLP